MQCSSLLQIGAMITTINSTHISGHIFSNSHLHTLFQNNSSHVTQFFNMALSCKVVQACTLVMTRILYQQNHHASTTGCICTHRHALLSACACLAMAHMITKPYHHNYQSEPTACANETITSQKNCFIAIATRHAVNCFLLHIYYIQGNLNIIGV